MIGLIGWLLLLLKLLFCVGGLYCCVLRFGWGWTLGAAILSAAMVLIGERLNRPNREAEHTES